MAGDLVECDTESIASEADISPKDYSLLYIAARFPVEVVKSMMEDIFPVSQQQGQMQKSTRQQTETEDESLQELTRSQKITLCTISGLSMVWYIFGY